MRTHTPYPPANRRHLCALRKLQRLRPTVLDLFPGRGENVVCDGSGVSDSSVLISALHCV
ncbi:hypothetical protein C0J45_22361 [Silurus meridionalis]|nr:hypothetical protein C0J45_22361 [Silurus meridionalis]